MATKNINRKQMQNLIKELDDIHLILLMERIVTTMDDTRESINENPKEWGKSIIHPRFFIHVADMVDKHFNRMPRVVKLLTLTAAEIEKK